MTSLFKTYMGIDYSGAKTPVSRNKGLRVFKATADTDPSRVKSPAGKQVNWTRKEIGFIRRNAATTNRPHFWPFDGFDIPPNKSVIVEIFPSIFRKRYPRRYKTTDEHDAMCVAQWLKDRDSRGLLNTYLNPPLTNKEREIARLEGWIMGIY